MINQELKAEVDAHFPPPKAAGDLELVTGDRVFSSMVTATTRSTHQSALVMALARARLAFGKIVKSHTAQYRTKAGGMMTYSYASLDNIQDATVNALSENELVVMSDTANLDPKSGLVRVTTELWHSSDQWRRVTVDLFLTDAYDTRAMGSLITYGRRYGQQLLLNIIAEDDDDGGATGSGNSGKKNPRPVRQSDPANAAPQDGQSQRAEEVGPDAILNAIRGAETLASLNIKYTRGKRAAEGADALAAVEAAYQERLSALSKE
jgi:hypothetical protein